MKRLVIRALLLVTMFLALLVLLPARITATGGHAGDTVASASPAPASNSLGAVTGTMPLADEAPPEPSPSPEAQLALDFIAQRERLMWLLLSADTEATL
jgi:hypothetical protein